ncbi:autotransporter-associated beta strand repeat-containing protein [Bradyrhizobium sp. 138]|uniref:autotransporter-associated beta strand repeat-containing protein n=1 Tax=Bradyrhizobium sp. 138 TaxID=2782615 RepID=UPI001FFC1709|nr:autotransporter-associated beta strand repeat-containing protein [Bradyrhizobium sp. 138]
MAWTLPATPARAQDATWLASPGSNSYITGANWDTGTRPTGTAYFGASNITDLSFFGGVTVGGWTFNAGASNYTFDLSSSQLTFTGAGIVINGGGATIDTNNFSLYFRNTSTAGGATINNNGIVQFFDSSTAGTAAITNNGQVVFSNSSTAGTAAISNNNTLLFSATSTAGSATITNNNGGATTFYANSTAGNAAITNNNGGTTTFYFNSTAGNATITNNGGITFDYLSTAGDASIVNNGGITFRTNSTAGNAAITNNAAGSVDFSGTTGLNGDNKISAGSIAGAGFYQLGANELTVGSNNLSTEVSGVIAGTGGSLVKIGTGTLTLSGANTYTGGTTVNGGTVQLGTLASAGSILGTIGIGSSGTLDVVNADTSGITDISNDGTAIFRNATSAGSASILNQGSLSFLDSSTASSATITNTVNLYFKDNASAGSAGITNSGNLDFSYASSAGSATINNQLHATMSFVGTSTAGAATITNNGVAKFRGTSTAGNATIANVGVGLLSFFDQSSAGNATITNAGSAVLTFYSQSSAGSANITNSNLLNFNDSSTAGSAVITNNGGISFSDWSTAGNATITNNGGLTFRNYSTAGNAAIINNANASVDLSNTSGPNGDNRIGAGSIAGAGFYLLGANELTVGSNNQSTEVSGVIAGTGGSLVKIGTGTLTLSGTNTYTGGTTINGGTLQLGTLASTGTILGTVRIGSSGTLDVVNADTSGITAITNDGTAIFRTASSAGSIAGAGFYDLGANQLTVGSSNLSTEVSGVIAGTGGSLVKIGTGTLTLSGTNTFTGGTTIAAGTLQIGNGGATGSIVGNVVNDGVLAFNRSDTITLAGDISGSGAVQQIGSGTTILTGDNSYTGGTTIAAGTLQIGNGGTTGSIVGNVVNDGVLAFNRSDAITWAGDISGSGALRQTGSGTTILTGDNSYTGGTTIAAGTLQIGNGGTTGSIVGNVVNDGVLAFNRSDAITLAGDISGSGSVQQIGSGTTILTGTNTYSGDTIVSSGRLQFGDGGTSGSNNLGGNLTVTGGTLAIQTATTLNVSQTVTFGNNTALSITAGTNSPALSADSVAIGNGVAFNISGISNASQLDQVLIGTRSGISGDFASVSIGGFSGTVDYLTLSTRKSIDGLQYLASYGLSWTAGNSLAHGTFTLTNATDVFTVGAALTDQAANAATGWNGTSLTKAGAGTLILSGANTYTGGSTVNGGTLQLGTAANVGTILGTVNVGASGTFDVVNADTSGITSLSNSGTTIFHNTSSASSAAISNNRTLNFNDTSTAGAATITNTATGTVNFNNSSSAGSATITNNNWVYFNDTSTAGSATFTNSSNGRAIFFGNATAGSADITNSNNAQLFFYGNSSAGNATITSNDWLSFNDTSTAGSATLTNNRWLYFYGNSTAGSAEITNSNLMVFRDAATAGNASIANSNTINFVVSSTAGSAVITNNAGGTTTFQDNSTAGNAQLINNAANAVIDFSGSSGPNGDHKLSAGSIAGNGTFYLGANELTVGGNNLSTIVSGVIADGGASGGTGGSLVKTGTGTLSLTGTNTYSGGTTFAGGTVIVSSDDNLGDLAGSLTFKGGTLQIRGTTFTTTARTINLGAGGGTFDIADAANNFVLSQNLGGTTLTKAGAGTLTLTGAESFSGATVSAGTLAFLDSTAGSAVITNNAQLAFYGNSTAGSATIHNSGNVLFDGNSTAGNAQLINTDPGAVFNFFTPGPSSDGRISAGSLAGNGRFDLNSTELTVGGNNLSTTVTGVVTGDGMLTGTSLIKGGTGTLTLSGNNTYTGATIVDGGALVVNGSIASSSSLTVNSGGTLGGTGIVGNTTIASGGTLAPGNSVGTLSVSGNLAFTAGSFYRVEVSTSAADRTNVSGTATLAGATVQAVAIPGSFRSQTYTILNATGGLGGTRFAGLSVAGSFSPTRNPHLTYDTNNVYLVLDPGTIVLPAGTGANQSSVAGAINKAVEGGATPPAGFDALLNMGQPQLNRGLSQVSGQPGAAGTQSAFNATQQFVNMLDPLGGGGTDGERGATGDGGTLGYASTSPRDAKVREAYAAVTPREASADVIDRRWGVWASGYGGASTLNGNAATGSSTTTSRIYGTVVGADYRASPNTLVGFALGGAGYNFSLSDNLGSGRADLFQAGLYARHTIGPAYVSAALAYGWQDVTTDRTVTVSGTDKLTANFKASTFSARLETGWRFAPIPTSSFGVTPYAAVQATAFHLPGYGETALVGSNQFALSYTSRDTTNVRTELGARTDQRFLVSEGVLTLRGRLAWAHDTNTSRFVNAAFQTLPGAAFTVSGARPAADSALAGGRAELKWRNGLSLAGTVEGEFSRSTRTYTGKGTVRYEW